MMTPSFQLVIRHSPDRHLISLHSPIYNAVFRLLMTTDSTVCGSHK